MTRQVFIGEDTFINQKDVDATINELGDEIMRLKQQLIKAKDVKSKGSSKQDIGQAPQTVDVETIEVFVHDQYMANSVKELKKIPLGLYREHMRAVITQFLTVVLGITVSDRRHEEWVNTSLLDAIRQPYGSRPARVLVNPRFPQTVVDELTGAIARDNERLQRAARPNVVDEIPVSSAPDYTIEELAHGLARDQVRREWHMTWSDGTTRTVLGYGIPTTSPTTSPTVPEQEIQMQPGPEERPF